MELFIIDKNIKAIEENLFYLEFFSSNEFYSDKYKFCLTTDNLISIDENTIRLIIYNNLNEMYINFKNEFYLWF